MCACVTWSTPASSSFGPGQLSYVQVHTIISTYSYGELSSSCSGCCCGRPLYGGPSVAFKSQAQMLAACLRRLPQPTKAMSKAHLGLGKLPDRLRFAERSRPALADVPV